MSYLEVKIKRCPHEQIHRHRTDRACARYRGSTYICDDQLLPPGIPLTVAVLRALPAGLALLLVVRQLPKGAWWWKSLILGALNFSLFWACLFVSAYRLPGGVAATVGAVQPLIRHPAGLLVLGSPVRMLAVLGGVAGMAGVALLVLTPKASLDTLGIAAGLGGAVSMACGTVMSRKWKPPVSPLTFTAWQLDRWWPSACAVRGDAGAVDACADFAKHCWLYLSGLIGAAFTYILWFRGLSRLEPAAVSALGFLSPLVAVLLGWLLLDQGWPVQITGMLVVLLSVWCEPAGADAGLDAQTRNVTRQPARRVTLLCDQAHSPLRMTGTRLPSSRTPSISTCPSQSSSRYGSARNCRLRLDLVRRQ